MTLTLYTGLLRRYDTGSGSTPNTASGKTATLTVVVSCEEGSTDPECVCGELSDCKTCMDDNQCIWEQGLCREAPSDITEKDRNRAKLSELEFGEVSNSTWKLYFCIFDISECLVGRCEFYNEVERIIPCDSSSEPYATQYGFRYCERFALYSSDFTLDVWLFPWLLPSSAADSAIIITGTSLDQWGSPMSPRGNNWHCHWQLNHVPSVEECRLWHPSGLLCEDQP